MYKVMHVKSAICICIYIYIWDVLVGNTTPVDKSTSQLMSCRCSTTSESSGNSCVVLFTGVSLVIQIQSTIDV